MMNRLFPATMSFLVCPLLMLCQETRGTLSGRITDASGALMPGVSVKAVHGETAVATTTTTNLDGLYQILFLLPGRYKVSAEAPSFKTTIREGIEIRVNDRVELNIAMEVGGVGERVEVVGETPLLETATASLGQVIDHRRIAELPLLHGNPMAVLDIAPGVAQARTADLGLWGGRVFDNGWTTSFAIDGASSNTHEITLDGVSNTTTLGGREAPRVRRSPSLRRPTWSRSSRSKPPRSTPASDILPGRSSI